MQLYEKGWKPILMVTDRSNQWLEIGRMWSGEYVEMKKGIKINDMKGKWNGNVVYINYKLYRKCVCYLNIIFDEYGYNTVLRFIILFFHICFNS